jgi:hypothetical protein
MDIELLYFEDCPNWETTDRHLQKLAPDASASVRHRLVRTPEEAEAFGFRGSPTVLVDGRDPFARGDEPVGLSCRIYQTPDGPAGSPSLAQLAAVLGVEPSPDHGDG